MSKHTAADIESLAKTLVGKKDWYGVLCAVRDHLAARGIRSNWRHLHKELIRNPELNTRHYLEVVTEHLRKNT
jgi:hypothetical protein